MSERQWGMDPDSAHDAAALLDAAEGVVVEVRRAEARRLRVAHDWAHANPPSPEQLARHPLCARSLGSAQLLVQAHVEAELAACLQVHPLAALRLMADAVDLEVRMPVRLGCGPRPATGGVGGAQDGGRHLGAQ